MSDDHNEALAHVVGGAELKRTTDHKQRVAEGVMLALKLPEGTIHHAMAMEIFELRAHTLAQAQLVTLMEQIASEAYAEWKEHRDMRAGKLLRALADPKFTKYRNDLDAARALVRETGR